MASVYNAARDSEEKFIHIEKLNKNYKIDNNFMAFLEFTEKQEEAEEAGKTVKIRDIVDLIKKSLGVDAFNEIMAVTTMNEVMDIFKIISASYQNITPAQLQKQKENKENEEEEPGK